MDPLRRIVQRWKYRPESVWGSFLGNQLADAISFRFDSTEPDAFVPIPLHRTRRIERGFNQAQQLCQVLSRRFNLPVRPVLHKRRRTRPQAGLSRTERLQNLSDTFSPKSNAADIRARHLVLVDDVYTTGSTLRGAAESLLREGAETVSAVVLARAV